ncbi:MAG TPA: MFS transporter [Candidatus Limnocylindria bacterium]|nr:MFS transporter [Candidatus Limnocylindria bacterium]
MMSGHARDRGAAPGLRQPGHAPGARRLAAGHCRRVDLHRQPARAGLRRGRRPWCGPGGHAAHAAGRGRRPDAGTVTDRFPRHRVLLAVHGLRGLAVLLVALAAMADLTPLFVFGAALLEGCVAPLHRATTLSLMPALARSPQELVAGNTSASLSEGLGVLTGPALGGLLAATVSVEAGLLAGAVCFGLAALAVLNVRPTSAGVEWEPSRERRLRQLLGGYLSLAQNPHVGLLVGLLGAQTFVRGALTVLLVAVAVELLLLGEGGVGYLNSAIGAGGLLGGLLALLLVGRRSLALPLLLGLAF